MNPYSIVAVIGILLIAIILVVFFIRGAREQRKRDQELTEHLRELDSLRREKRFGRPTGA